MRLFTDLYSDISVLKDSNVEDPAVVWINGLAKSGTSLIEDIVASAQYVEGFRSPYRYCHVADDHRQGGVSDYLFDCFPRRRRTYVKTHTKYGKKVEALIQKQDIKVIVSIRDICDALVSRYYHILSDPRHWQHRSLCKLLGSNSERFLRSIEEINPETGLSSAEYYAQWISGWVHSPRKQNIICFEEYVDDPIRYIVKVAELLDIKSIDPYAVEDMLKKKRSVMSNASSRLWIRRLLFSNRSGTFRSGKSGSYQELRGSDSDRILATLRKRYGVEKY